MDKKKETPRVKYNNPKGKKELTLEEKQAEVRAEIEGRYKEDSKGRRHTATSRTTTELRDEEKTKPKGRTGGRQKGTPNKRTRLTEELVEKILKKHKFDPFEAQVKLAQDLQDEIDKAKIEQKPKEVVANRNLLSQVLRDMLPVVYAKRKALETEQNVTTTSNHHHTLTIVTTKEHSVEEALAKAEKDAKGEGEDETKKEDSGQTD